MSPMVPALLEFWDPRLASCWWITNLSGVLRIFTRTPDGEAARDRVPVQAGFLAARGLPGYKPAGNCWLAPTFDTSTVGSGVTVRSEFITLDHVSGTISQAEHSIDPHFEETADLRRFLLSGARPKDQPSKEDQASVVQWLQERLHKMQLRAFHTELELETERQAHRSCSTTPVPADGGEWESGVTVPLQMRSSLDEGHGHKSSLQQLDSSVDRGQLE
uniref:Uncharacterized protein n=1 Tax=Sphaerodactylus townsendi TaxID=933632 RepID=A0ACB8FTD8_9SAUR